MAEEVTAKEREEHELLAREIVLYELPPEKMERYLVLKRKLGLREEVDLDDDSVATR